MFDWKCQSVAKHYLCFRHTLYSRHNFIHMSVRKSKGKVKSDTNDQLRPIAKAQRSNASLQCVRAIARNRRFLTSWQVLFLDVSDWQSPDWRRFVRLLFHRVPTLVQDWRAIMQCVALCSVEIAATVQCALKRRHQCGNIADVQLATRMWVQRQRSLCVLTALRNCF